MKHPRHRLLALSLLLASLPLPLARAATDEAAQTATSPGRADAPGLDTARIEKLTGARGALDAKEGVFKVSVPRSDLAVRVGGARITPRLGLTSWAAFQRAGAQAMVMGDIVLLEAEVDPVMSAALDAGLEVTALHNHFLWDAPRVMFLHVGGHGPADDLASAVGRVFRAAEEARGRKARTVDVDPARSALDAEAIGRILGARGELADGVLRVTLPKTTRMHGETVGAAMGVNTWAAFAGSDREAVVDGDFAMFEAEVQAVLKALRQAGISVVALHNHMIGEEPRVIFLHYWGTGPAADLARGLRSALDAQAAASRQASTAPPAAGPGGTVLFVCEHGSAKSVVAAAHFNRLAAARGLPFRAVSRGTVPDAEMAPAAVRGLLADGLLPGDPVPTKLARADLDRAARVVAFNDLPGELTAGTPVERWEVPPVSTEYAASRDAMLARIEQLLQELTRQ